MNATPRAQPHTSIKTSLAALLAAVLLSALLPLSAAAQTSTNLGDPCRGATSAATEFADYSQVREAHRASLDCAFYRAIWPGTATTTSGDRLYLPLTLVTRAQIAQFIHDALVAAGYDELLPAGRTDQFNDIAAATERLAINRLAEAGIIHGMSATRYAPAANVSRQQLATLLVQAANFALDVSMPSDGQYRFTDVAMSNVHKVNIENGADAGLFRGRTASTFGPGGLVRRDEMASFSINLLRYSFDPAAAPLPFQAQAMVTRTIVEQGDHVTGTVNGSNLSSATVQGCGISSQTLSDRDPFSSGIQFSLGTSSSLPTGSCTLQFVFRFANGSTQPGTVVMTVREQSTEGGGTIRGRTPQPELVLAKITDVDTSGTDAGMTVRYTFDEAIESAANVDMFYVVHPDGSRYAGDAFVGTTHTDNNAMVDVYFAGPSATPAGTAPETQAEADKLTVATVDFGVVHDSSNLDNPEGDAPLGDLSGGSTSLRAGITNAPDLTRVDVRNEIGNTDEVYDVMFTFDESVATATTGLDEFTLILEDGTTIPCGTTDGTPASVDVEAECGTLGGAEWVPGDASRGIVWPAVVADSGGNLNVLQASEAEGDDGNTPLPDLVSAKFYPGLTDSDVDVVAYTFDEPIKLGTGGCGTFSVYTRTAGEFPADDCWRDSTYVIVAEFDPDALDEAVGVAVYDDAAAEDSTFGAGNRGDEVGVANSSTTTGAGFTFGPDLTKVSVAQEKSVLGTVRGVLVTYTFDEDIETLLDVTRFYVYDTSGDRYQATSCEATDPGDETTVECTAFEEGGTALDLDGEKDLYSEAGVGTVDDGVVEDNDGYVNPEGAAR